MQIIAIIFDVRSDCGQADNAVFIQVKPRNGCGEAGGAEAAPSLVVSTAVASGVALSLHSITMRTALWYAVADTGPEIRAGCEVLA